MAIPTILFLLPIAALALAGRRSGGGSPPLGPWSDQSPPEPLYVGQRGDPELETLLSQMDATFRSYGVKLDWIDAAEVTVMRKTNGYHAIPPKGYWPRMAATIVYGFQPIRRALKGPIVITSAYRPPDYNEAVGGEEGSRHQFFEALDMVAPKGMANQQALVAAKLWVTQGANMRLGLGIYGEPGAASNIHIDTGHDQRTWQNARYWIGRITTT